jgi:hypothetical protein
MLSRITKGVRLRAALTLALIYALCVVAPPLALAFSDGAVAAHCLTEDHGFSNEHTLHVHDQADVRVDAVADKHADAVAAPTTHNEKKRDHHSGTCCGLFCHATAPNSQISFSSDRISQSVISPALDDHLTGRGPDRLHRPPIAL